MFIYWQYISLSVASSIWHTDIQNKELYDQAARWTSLQMVFTTL